MTNNLIIAALHVDAQIDFEVKKSQCYIYDITTTFSNYGEDKCFLKYTISTGNKRYDPNINDFIDCYDGEKIYENDNTVTEYYDSETDALLAWSRLIREMNPNVITGYDISFFGLKILYKRAKFLNCWDEFSKLGVNDEHKLTLVKGEKYGGLTEDEAFEQGYKDTLYNFIIKDKIIMDLSSYIHEKFKVQDDLLEIAKYFLKTNKYKNMTHDTFYHNHTKRATCCNKLVNVLDVFVNV